MRMAVLFPAARRHGSRCGMSVLIKNVLVYRRGRTGRRCGSQAGKSPGSEPDPATAEIIDAEVIDATGQVLLPGFVDLHTHLRESRAAKTPKPLTPVRPQRRWAAIPRRVRDGQHESGRRQFGRHRPCLAAWSGSRPGRRASGGRGHRRAGGASNLPRWAPWPQAQARCGSSPTTVTCVADPLIMRRALEYAESLGVLIAQHAEELETDRRRRGPRGRDLGSAWLGRVAACGRGVHRRS